MPLTNIYNPVKHLLCCFLAKIINGLTYFIPLASFGTPWKHQKTSGFLMFSGRIEREQWHEAVNQFRKKAPSKMYDRVVNTALCLSLSWRKSLSYRSQSIDFHCIVIFNKCKALMNWNSWYVNYSILNYLKNIFDAGNCFSL